MFQVNQKIIVPMESRTLISLPWRRFTKVRRLYFTVDVIAIAARLSAKQYILLPFRPQMDLALGACPCGRLWEFSIESPHWASVCVPSTTGATNLPLQQRVYAPSPGPPPVAPLGFTTSKRYVETDDGSILPVETFCRESNHFVRYYSIMRFKYLLKVFFQNEKTEAKAQRPTRVLFIFVLLQLATFLLEFIALT